LSPALSPAQRWLALYVLCCGVLMIVLDTTIVNVALPSIRSDLGFSETALVWVVNAYLLTFGGCLLLGGRLGDLYGHRRLFLAGLVLFTLASAACGLSLAREVLVTARAVQGVGGAVVTAVALSLIMDLFPDEAERARAMGIYGFVCSAGGSIGVLLGGALTTLSWHWIFLVNLPIGVAVYVYSRRLLPATAGKGAGQRLDAWGAATITAALMLAVYAVVNGNEAGWTSLATLGQLGLATALLLAFLVIEARAPAPLMPLGFFRRRSLATANAVAVLWAAAMFAWFFIAALYMQLVLGYTPMQVGLAFLPADLIMAVFSLGLSAKLVMRYGLRWPLAAGLALAAAGLACFAFAPVRGEFWWHVSPGMALLGLGGGIAFNPLLLAAMSETDPADSGLASGIVNTSFMMGGALGLAVLASLAAAHTAGATAAGLAADEALTAGYRLAFGAGAVAAALAALLGALLIRDKASAAAGAPTLPAH
jgi:EmrB/QacA subfamily drug resistance transporter